MGMSSDFEQAVSTIYANFRTKPLIIIIIVILQIELGNINIRVGPVSLVIVQEKKNNDLFVVVVVNSLNACFILLRT